MPESDLMIAIHNNENDDGNEEADMKDIESNTSPNLSKAKRTRLTFPFGACRVCSDSATGIHYGIATCEGCKGFFKRSILRKEKYRCYFDNTCVINVTNRNRCKACRFRRCIDEGMSVDGVKMGRIPKLVKERALKELKEQQMKEAALAETNEGHARESSCSSISDRSIENYDPNIMETESEPSPIQRHSDLIHPYANDNYEKKLINPSFVISNQPSVSMAQSNLAQHTKAGSSLSNNHEQKKSPLIYRTKYPTFLPDDFTVDETDGVGIQSTGLLSDDLFKHVKTISNKFFAEQSVLFAELNEEETAFIRDLRKSAYNIFLQRSRRVKQLISRMNHLIANNIYEYPGDDRTLEEFFQSIQLACQVLTRATVIHVQELPGMLNMGLKTVEKLIFHRAFDWYTLKYHELYNDNGQGYVLGPDGFQYTRYWMNQINGKQLTDEAFKFCHLFRELHLSDNEMALVLPLQFCSPGPSIENDEVVQMLRSCYLFAFYTQLCHNRGEMEGKRLCRKTLEVLEHLIPLDELYDKNAATRKLEV